MAFQFHVFDAYGTLFDVHAAVRRHSAALGAEAAGFSAYWRTKQLEYTWVRSLAGTYKDFWCLTEEALDASLAAFPKVDRSLRGRLLDAYRMLDCYPEVPDVLKTLKAQGAHIAILSNGTLAMLEEAVTAAGLGTLIDTILSVDAIRCYKPDRRVYELATTHFRAFPNAISFQSSNRWDAAGAAHFGFRSVWINRTDAWDEYADMTPAAILKDLTGLSGL